MINYSMLLTKSAKILAAFFVLSFFVSLWSNLMAEEGSESFDPMDVFELEWASDPRVSSDGNNDKAEIEYLKLRVRNLEDN